MVLELKTIYRLFNGTFQYNFKILTILLILIYSKNI